MWIDYLVLVRYNENKLSSMFLIFVIWIFQIVFIGWENALQLLLKQDDILVRVKCLNGKKAASGAGLVHDLVPAVVRDMGAKPIED